jgi:hypothetical protein
MTQLTLTKSFRDDDPTPDYPYSTRWATYHWGDLAIREYDAVNWRGNSYRVETADNPFDFIPELPDAVMTLDHHELNDHIPWDPRLAVEWWNTQQPGLLLGLEAKADGTLWAEVWTGLIEVWGNGYSQKRTTTPQTAAEHWNSIVVLSNGDVNISRVTTMVGPVGLVSELDLITVYPTEESDSDLDMDVWGALR